MQKIIFSLLFLSVFGLANAQETIFDENAIERKIGSFHAIEASSGISVIISSGAEEKLAVSVSSADWADKVKTEVRDGVLKIWIENDWKVWKMPKNFSAKVYISYKAIDMVKASSGASIKGQISAGDLTARQSSGGIVALKGTAHKLTVDASSGGVFKGYDLVTSYLDADASSGGGVYAQVTQEVNAEASSGGFVTFKGAAVIRDIKVNSGGSVKRAKD
jgi:Putative auto-transporter adhesin, head GIN domain